LNNNSELQTFLEKRHNKTNFQFVDADYTYVLKYNEYNKKFINKIQNYIDVKNLQDFLQMQSNFLESLSMREIYTLKYYTYHGDIFECVFRRNI
jgi:hypothetical protein